MNYAASPPAAPAVHHTSSPTPADSASLDHLLRDKQLLALLVGNLLSSEEFERAMAARHSASQDQVNAAVSSAITDALSKFNQEFNKVVSKTLQTLILLGRLHLYQNPFFNCYILVLD